MWLVFGLIKIISNKWDAVLWRWPPTLKINVVFTSTFILGKCRVFALAFKQQLNQTNGGLQNLLERKTGFCWPERSSKCNADFCIFPGVDYAGRKEMVIQLLDLLVHLSQKKWFPCIPPEYKRELQSIKPTLFVCSGLRNPRRYQHSTKAKHTCMARDRMSVQAGSEEMHF